MKKKIMILGLITILLVSGCASSPKDKNSGNLQQLEVDSVKKQEYAEYKLSDDLSGETYLGIEENAEHATSEESLLTFSLKVDTASYNNVERYLESGNLPPMDAVRTEELINYFKYDTDMEFSDEPFSIMTEVGPSPFASNKHFAFVRVKSKSIDQSELPKSNLTFLIDTSGSMNSYDKLPLLQSAFALLVETLSEEDCVSIVTYAGSSQVVLDSVSGGDKDKILAAINNLNSGGSTAGADGILTAYKLAEKNFIDQGNNRIILATDGDFNVGISSTGELEKLVAKKRDNGVYLSLLGFGTGNLDDATMETLSKHGNGNYAYINSISSAQKVLVDELGSNLFTIADDVKAQIQFNAETVKSYRLIGYENRQLENEDFEDDTKDAGEIGVGTDVIVLFELELEEERENNELFEVRIRYKDPGESTSNLMTAPVASEHIKEKNSSDFNFAVSVAAFGDLLRDSEYSEDVQLDQISALAKESLGADQKGYRKGFIQMIKSYKDIVND